jgi:hypothetical protein
METNLNWVTQLTSSYKLNKTLWPEFASDRHLSAELVPTFADRGCHVVSMMDPYGHILGFIFKNYKSTNKYTLNGELSKENEQFLLNSLKSHESRKEFI